MLTAVFSLFMLTESLLDQLLVLRFVNLAASLAAHTRGRNIRFATGTGDHRATANHVFAARGQTVQRAGRSIATANTFQSILGLHGLTGFHHLLDFGEVLGNAAAFLIAAACLTATLVGVRLVGHVQASAGNDAQTGIANRGVHGAAVHLASAATLVHATDMGPAELRGVSFLDVAIDLGVDQVADLAAVLAGLATGIRRTGAAFGLHADLAATLISAGRNRTQASLGPRVHGFFRLPARGVNLLVGVSRKALGLLLHCGPCGLCHLRHYSSPWRG